jgi:hypothetical protein
VGIRGHGGGVDSELLNSGHSGSQNAIANHMATAILKLSPCALEIELGRLL